MKRTLQRTAVLISAALVAAAAGACAPIEGLGGTNETVDPSRTQLYVQNFEGGFGSDWLYAIKPEFEEMYRSQSFEEGKQGVQIMIRSAKKDGISMRPDINASPNEVFFNESVYYYDYLKDGLLLDISDAMTSPLSEFGESESIEDKMTAEQIAYYKADGKYYGIPHYAGYNCIVYDKDLFDDPSYLFYFADADTPEFIVDPDDKRSAGPDGEFGTSDDGLPATYDEFFLLCDRMVESGVIPMIWPGQYYNTYIEKIINALYADDVGLEQTMINYTFKGHATNILEPVASDGSYSYKYGEEGVDITPENAYLMWAQEGRYHSLSFFDRVISNSAYYPTVAFSPSHLYNDSQKDFLESTPKGRPIGMIVEGVWWENEAKDSIKAIADYYDPKYSRENRHFAVLPLPKSSEEKIGQKSTIVDTHYSLGFIKASIAPQKAELAKAFLRYVCTDKALSAFTVSTNTVKALDYDISSEDYGKLTCFGKSVYDMHKSSDIVYPFSPEAVYLDNQSLFSVHESLGSRIGNEDAMHPIEFLRSHSKNTVEDYFNGMIVYNQARWDRVFGGYFS